MRLLLTAETCPKGEVATNLSSHHELLVLGSDSECDLVLMPEIDWREGSLVVDLPRTA